jgi:hypothetical protein
MRPANRPKLYRVYHLQKSERFLAVLQHVRIRIAQTFRMNRVLHAALASTFVY